jgi:hypothetical protein
MTRIVKYSHPIPFEKAGGGFTPAVSSTAKPKNPTEAKVRLADNVAIDDEIGEADEAKKGTTMADYDISRGPYHAILDKMALARQAQTGESYAKAYTEVYTDPRNTLIRDGARFDHLAKAMDATHGTRLSLILAAKAAAPMDEVQDYVSPGPAHDELDRLIVTRMKADPKLSYQQSFTREYLAPENRSLKQRVDQESILRMQRMKPAPPFPAYIRG